MGSFLAKGVPQAWLMGIRKRQNHLLHDFNSFVKAFETHFKDLDAENTTQRKLEKLTQIGSAAAYAARFRKTISFLDLSDFTQQTYFYNGLKSRVKDAMVACERPKNFEELEKLAIKIDNRIFTRQNEGTNRQTHFTPNPNPFSTPTTTTTPATSGVTPMDLVDAVSFTKLTPAERKRCMDNNLCLYC